MRGRDLRHGPRRRGRPDVPGGGQGRESPPGRRDDHEHAVAAQGRGGPQARRGGLPHQTGGRRGAAPAAARPHRTPEHEPGALPPGRRKCPVLRAAAGAQARAGAAGDARNRPDHRPLPRPADRRDRRGLGRAVFLPRGRRQLRVRRPARNPRRAPGAAGHHVPDSGPARPVLPRARPARGPRGRAAPGRRRGGRASLPPPAAGALRRDRSGRRRTAPRRRPPPRLPGEHRAGHRRERRPRAGECPPLRTGGLARRPRPADRHLLARLLPPGGGQGGQHRPPLRSQHVGRGRPARHLPGGESGAQGNAGAPAAQGIRRQDPRNRPRDRRGRNARGGRVRGHRGGDRLLRGPDADQAPARRAARHGLFGRPEPRAQAPGLDGRGELPARRRATRDHPAPRPRAPGSGPGERRAHPRPERAFVLERLRLPPRPRGELRPPRRSATS